MIIKPYVSIKEMKEEVKMWNESGLSSPKTPAILKEFMLVENDFPESKQYKYHVYCKEGNRYRLINNSPFNFFLETEKGQSFDEDQELLQSLI